MSKFRCLKEHNCVEKLVEHVLPFVQDSAMVPKFQAGRFYQSLHQWLQRLHGDRFTIDRTLGMIGSRESLAAIKAQVDPRAIAPTWSPALDGFRARRASSLLY